MDQQLIMACQMFLVPATILFAALGVASTEALKTVISLMGVATSGVWYYRILEWSGLKPADSRAAHVLAGLFLLAWLGSLIVHAYRWGAGEKASPTVSL
jgi:hypothetical protein